MTGRPLHIAILGTRGIPNRYGGFEQFAEHLGVALVKGGHRVTVYNSSLHPYRDKTWNGVDIRHCIDYEHRLGTAGQFIYDLNCILDARQQHFDVILQLGYTSSSLWFPLWPNRIPHVVNMDGLEYLRSKYGAAVRLFLRLAERMATWRATALVADNPAIETHLRAKYAKPVHGIPYGADIPEPQDVQKLKRLGLEPKGYDLVIARIEPENHVRWMCELYAGQPNLPRLLVVGERSTPLGRKLPESENVIYAGALYDKPELDALRQHSRLYLHGHSVGGTNPSLLEAMACEARIIAHDNVFNRAVLEDRAIYFGNPRELEAAVLSPGVWQGHSHLEVMSSTYSWAAVVEAYENLFYDVVTR